MLHQQKPTQLKIQLVATTFPSNYLEQLQFVELFLHAELMELVYYALQVHLI